MQRRTRSNSSPKAILAERLASVGRRLKEVLGDGHCGMWALIDQLHQQGIHVTLKSLRGDTAAWLSDKEYAWSNFPQDDAKDWETFLEQVGHCGPQGYWVNHLVFAAVACRYNCDLTIVQSMPDASQEHAFVLLSGKQLALSLTDAHYAETKKWQDLNVPTGVEPLFLAQRDLEHFLSSELVQAPQRGAGGGAAAAGASTSGQGGTNETPAFQAAPATPSLPAVRPNRPSRASSRSGNVVPPSLLPGNPRNLNLFHISDSSDSASPISVSAAGGG